LYRRSLLNFLLSNPRSAVTYTLAGTLGIMGIMALWSLSPPFPISKFLIWLCSLHKAIILLDLNFPAFEILSPPFCDSNRGINMGDNLGSVLTPGLSEQSVKHLCLLPNFKPSVYGGFRGIFPRQQFPLAARFQHVQYRFKALLIPASGSAHMLLRQEPLYKLPLLLIQANHSH
jgi:hypothetical protein